MSRHQPTAITPDTCLTDVNQDGKCRPRRYVRLEGGSRLFYEKRYYLKARPVPKGWSVTWCWTHRDATHVAPDLGDALDGALSLAGDVDLIPPTEEQRAFFRMGRRTLSTRLIDGQFPDYERVVPKENQICLEFIRLDLVRIVKRMKILSGDKSKLVQVACSRDKVWVSLKNASESAQDIIAVDYEGSELSIGFNVDYLLDFLLNMRDEKVQIRIRDEATQGLFTVSSEIHDLDYKHVIMPMRLA
ncbi:MAG: hypothetical protein QNK37_34395 [Acidobacteriota bacterium]|nr:hypothetical protein [Acidobacteriota bacterium]